MQLMIGLLDSSRKTWQFNTPGMVRIGRDPSCEICLSDDAYAMVSRTHVSLTIEDSGVRFSDLGSSNGVLRNGVADKGGDLRDNDVLQLGPAGPSLAFRLNAAVQRPAVMRPVRAETPDANATRLVNEPPTTIQPDYDKTSLAQGQYTVVAPQLGNAPAAASLPQFGIAASKPEAPAPAAPQPVKPGRAEAAASPEILVAMEKKLKALYLLTVALAAMVAIMLGFTFYLSAQIEKNRQQLLEIEAQADDQLQKLSPQLKTRLDTFDKQVNSVDERMQSAQDHFIQRLNTELPALMDRYIAAKTREVEKKGLNGLAK